MSGIRSTDLTSAEFLSTDPSYTLAKKAAITRIKADIKKELTILGELLGENELLPPLQRQSHEVQQIRVFRKLNKLCQMDQAIRPAYERQDILWYQNMAELTAEHFGIDDPRNIAILNGDVIADDEFLLP